MTPSKKATADIATNAAMDIDELYGTTPIRPADVAAIIGKHFADVIRKAAAMDALDETLRMRAGSANAQFSATKDGKVQAWSDHFQEWFLEDTLPAAIEALAAKIGAKNV